MILSSVLISLILISDIILGLLLITDRENSADSCVLN